MAMYLKDKTEKNGGHRVTIRMSDEMFETFIKSADRMGLSPSDYARSLIAQANYAFNKANEALNGAFEAVKQTVQEEAKATVKKPVEKAKKAKGGSKHDENVKTDKHNKLQH